MILKGKVFTDTEFKKIIKASEVNDLFDKALHYISFAQRSEYEIYCYLGEKGANDDEKKKIIKKMNSQMIIIQMMNNFRVKKKFMKN